MQAKKSMPIICLIILICAAGLLYKDHYNTINPDMGDKIIVRIAHVLTEDSPSHLGALYFKEELERRSDGRFEVQIFPNSQLGGDRQAIEAVSIGTINTTIPGTSVLSGFEEKFMVGDMPFLFKSRDAAYMALDNEFGDELNKLLEKHNLINLGYMENGYRQITNSVRPIHTPEDLNGIKIRTMENTIHMESFKAWGANPTPMSFSELFTALQQKTIDAQENPIQIIRNNRFYEVQDYLSITGHFFATASFIVNKEFYDGLPDDLREIFYETSRDMVFYQREICDAAEADYLSELIDNGMQVNELTSEEKDLFIAACQSIYDEYEPLFTKELIDLARKYND